jgi:outer membrane immunogenic protein
LVGAVAAALVLAVPAAQAADFPVGPVEPVPVVAPFSWNGFYVGLNAGAHIGKYKLSTTTTPGIFITPANAAAIDAASPATLTPQGAILGIQGGYNWQFGSAVLGVEADLNLTGGRIQSRTLVSTSGNSMTSSVQPTGLLTVRPRLGWTWERALVYVTAGYAMETVRPTDTFVGFGGTVTANPRQRLSGWTVGAGVEYAFSNAWSAKFEYLYVDLGNFNTSLSVSPTDVIAFNHKYTDNIVRAGVNYRFGW